MQQNWLLIGDCGTGWDRGFSLSLCVSPSQNEGFVSKANYIEHALDVSPRLIICMYFWKPLSISANLHGGICTHLCLYSIVSGVTGKEKRSHCRWTGKVGANFQDDEGDSAHLNLNHTGESASGTEICKHLWQDKYMNEAAEKIYLKKKSLLDCGVLKSLTPSNWNALEWI